MLAVPRPLQLERILPMVSSLGISTLVLCGANKVEKMYFGSHLFREPETLRAKLVEGLCQCGDTALPNVIVARQLKRFLEDDIDTLFPSDRWARVVAHPRRLGDMERYQRELIRSVTCCPPADTGVLVTVGPEGGWDEPYELELLSAYGFQVCAQVAGVERGYAV
ncbi:unnamed protein product [Choristocarpus tenellus]